MKLFRLFRSTRREIFTYWDGERERRLDPLVAWRQLWGDTECNPQRDFGPATGASGEPYDPEAMDRVLALIEKMFGSKPWDEKTDKGLTVNERLSLLWAYLGYMTELKKKQGHSQTQSPATDSESSPTTSEPITPPVSDSSSMPAASTSDEQPSSSTE